MLALNNFFVDLAALLAVSIFRKKRARAYRLLAGAIWGTLGSCAVFLFCGHMAVYFLVVHFFINPLVLFFSFRETGRKDFFTDLCVGYFAFLIIGGITEWLYADGNGVFPYELAVGIAVPVLIVAAFWHRRQKRKRVRYLKAELWHEEVYISLQALSDSGNLLRDPYTGKNVNLIDKTVYVRTFGPPQAVRMIPYESLGCQHGLLEAVTIEKLSYVLEDGEIQIEQAVLGLADHTLFERKSYQMIINESI